MLILNFLIKEHVKFGLTKGFTPVIRLKLTRKSYNSRNYRYDASKIVVRHNPLYHLANRYNTFHFKAHF